MGKSGLIIFSDFDGTFTSKDVGNRVFTHFSGGKNEQLVRDWKRGLITSRECLTREASLIRITEEELHSFVGSFELSPGAVEVYWAARGNEIPFYLVSDGLDIYIKDILERNHLSEIPYYANTGTIREGRLTIEFPFDNDGCPRCGSCKGARIEEIMKGRTDDRRVVFIGDGLSDICAIPKADTVFARGDLLHFCRRKKVTAIEYNDFFDILDWLKNSGYIAG